MVSETGAAVTQRDYEYPSGTALFRALVVDLSDVAEMAKDMAASMP